MKVHLVREGVGDVEAMMKELGLKEEYLDDVIFEQEEAPPPKTTPWMGISRVHMVKIYNQLWFF